MASLKSPLLFLAIFLLSNSLVHCDDEEDNLFLCLNSHRAYLNLPTFTHNEAAECLAEEVAEILEDRPCNNGGAYTKYPYQKDHNITDLILKCHINITHTKYAVVLPVCVPKLEPTVVFTNYTRTYFEKFINDSKFTQIGMDSENDWMVIVLGTNSSDGDLAVSGAVTNGLGFGRTVLGFLLGLVLYLAY
ncbi:uncharacterized GPI-anchored protein At3g06035-like [Mercurialis annua]|uniref:uncharacterized GPI-anchored protein At3g06035-like n=1 Tax=Mercurialis annua TaxID=3986 RepID=UPI00215E3D0E|nr:uncharacterized GPI-anchored protein At3g06035-like [Mercurialis annua]